MWFSAFFLLLFVMLILYAYSLLNQAHNLYDFIWRIITMRASSANTRKSKVIELIETPKRIKSLKHFGVPTYIGDLKRIGAPKRIRAPNHIEIPKRIEAPNDIIHVF